MLTYRLDVEYDGSRYRGWQIQKDARSVAGELQRALVAAGIEVLELGAAGRTDAGVHALGQVAHLRVGAPIEPRSLCARVNDALPPDVNVVRITRADARFHARHHAVSRSYIYQLSRRRTALAKRYVWWVKEPLDVDRMRRVAAAIVGRHDFTRLCERPAKQKSTVVVVESCEVEAAGELVLVRIVASHFLWRMVRRVVGVLARIGTHNIDPAMLGRLLDPAGHDDLPDVGPWTAPASGLFLERVVYRGEPALGPLVPAVALRSQESG